MLEEILSTDTGGCEEELGKLRRAKAEIETKINNILDNITSENREFADRRIRELKRELREVLPRLEEL